MYEVFFGFTKRPFASVPRVDEYFPGAAIESARQTLIRCIQRGEGTGIVIGPSGTGKTLLGQMLAEQFKDILRTVHLASGRLSTRRALLQAVLFGLGQPYRGMDEGELRLALVDYLTLGEQCAQGMLLLVDEAHTLPLRLVDEIRMITNLVCRGQPRVRLVLAGAPALEERLACPKLEAFNQRIVARCYLESFNREETQRYVEAQLKASGVKPGKLITADACHAIYQATDGVPRLINQVCDHALLLALARGRRQIDRGEIEEAWADLQQLPTPWNGDEIKEEGAVIEFGGLVDEPADELGADGDSGESAPTLRVAPATEDAATSPAEQVAKIQQALASLDDDFQPAGSIGPELELFFDDLDNPFSEEFEEEEIVVDRYRTVCRSRRQEHTMVATRPETEAETSDEPARETGTGVFPAAAVAASTDARKGLPSPSEESETYPAEHAYRELAAEAEELVRETVRLRPEEPAGAEAEEDENLILVEDGYEEFEVAHAPKSAPVRRREYRQLFARLRRSC